MESEVSAASVVLGAAAAGSGACTASAPQGVLLLGAGARAHRRARGRTAGGGGRNGTTTIHEHPALLDLRHRQPRFDGLEAGHRACRGRSGALATRRVTETAVPTGVEAAFARQGRTTKVLAFAGDLAAKVRRGMAAEGPAFLLVYSPCPLGWAHDAAKTVEVARLAVETGVFPVVEFERGQLVSVLPIREVRPIEEFLALRGRFAHLLGDDPRAREEREHLRALAQANIDRFGLLAREGEETDTRRAVAVRRGGRIR